MENLTDSTSGLLTSMWKSYDLSPGWPHSRVRVLKSCANGPPIGSGHPGSSSPGSSWVLLLIDSGTAEAIEAHKQSLYFLISP